MSEDEDADAGEMSSSVIERLQETLDATVAELAEHRERILLLLAEAKSLRSVVRGLAATEPLAALDGGQLLCWACSVVTSTAGTYHQDGVDLAADEVVTHTHRDDHVAHLPTCAWYLAATYEPGTGKDAVDDARRDRLGPAIAGVVDPGAGDSASVGDVRHYVPLEEAAVRLGLSETLVARLWWNGDLAIGILSTDLERLLAERARLDAALSRVEAKRDEEDGA